MPGNLKVTLDIDGERQLSRKLHGLLHQVSDLRPAFEAMAADWSATMQRKFESEGAHEAGTDEAGTPNPPWEPLSARYAAWKARRFPGRPILQRTGALRQAAAMDNPTDGALCAPEAVGNGGTHALDRASRS